MTWGIKITTDREIHDNLLAIVRHLIQDALHREDKHIYKWIVPLQSVVRLQCPTSAALLAPDSVQPWLPSGALDGI